MAALQRLKSVKQHHRPPCAAVLRAGGLGTGSDYYLIIFIIAFQLMPALSIVVKSFQDLNGHFTLDNINAPQYTFNFRYILVYGLTNFFSALLVAHSSVSSSHGLSHSDICPVGYARPSCHFPAWPPISAVCRWPSPLSPAHRASRHPHRCPQ